MTNHIKKIVVLAYIIIVSSACYVLILRGLQSAPPFVFAGFRTILGGGTLLVFSRLSGQGIFPERRLWKWLPGVALTATTLTFGSMFVSPSFTGAGLASILGNAQPLFIVLIAFIFLGERLSFQQVIAFFLVVAGVLIIILPSFTQSEGSLLTGAALALTTSLAAAIGTVIGRHLKLSESLLAFSAWQLILGGAVLIVLSLLMKEPVIQWNLEFFGILIILAIFNSAVISCGWFWLLQQVKAGELAIYLFLVPVLGVLWAYLFRGEQPELSSIMGGMLILIGIFCQELKYFKTEKT
ncbi:MAG: DMT family transporter [Desulfuromusa sp.]|nr:DMT family transporter [Desulfuromusa sp.]